MNYRTQLKKITRDRFGGSYFDSLSHENLFRSYKPHNFGMITSQMFSSKLGEHLINKKFTYWTVARNNVHYLPGGVDDYEWCLETDSEIDYTISEVLVTPDSFPGKGKTRFPIALHQGWLHEPVMLKTESADLPFLKVIGHGVRIGPNSFRYEVELQTGDENAWIFQEYLQPGRTLIDASTQVADELNLKFAGDQYAEMFKLQSWVGNYARKCEFTDKFIRREIGCREKGERMSKGAGMGYSAGNKRYYDAVGVGYTYQKSFRDRATNKVYKQGYFITMVEARMLERIERDREFACEWGQLEKTIDHDSDRTIKFGPGWRQLVKDGHYKEHNGTLTLSDIYEFLMNIFITRRGFSDRYIRIATGEAGLEFLHRLLAQEAGAVLLADDNHFIKKTSSPHNQNALQLGAQFTKWISLNGLVVEFVHDPIKDDRSLFPEKAPGTNRTLESFAMDIFDFGATDQKAEGARPENITMIMQDGVEAYWTVCNVYDFHSGAKTDGSNAYNNGKTCGIYREMSGSIGIWDVSRVGRLAFIPWKGVQ